ncbi:transcriptional regulator [candidate division WWE3 bacterium CG08_land_8_20_14_0_20_41_15]|uniref:Transcriptional regulator n=1 Tax=candidate division WWE3 bacterium CG08_land_8_20_14_0_20_41_15 TaxID=1975086 RepID=A0A2H0XAZ6_UNCKA|nr:MAG: transcriptional regulator [candidate division WWE3 bacterium CG08_land_8_20_14_0_20_41_15]
MKNKKDLIPFEKIERKWMKDPNFVREYQKLQPEFDLAMQIIDARTKNEMTQEDLAKKAGTGQAVISRLEGMNARPSLSLLTRIAAALDTDITITIRGA